MPFAGIRLKTCLRYPFGVLTAEMLILVVMFQHWEGARKSFGLERVLGLQTVRSYRLYLL